MKEYSSKLVFWGKTGKIFWSGYYEDGKWFTTGRFSEKKRQNKMKYIQEKDIPVWLKIRPLFIIIGGGVLILIGILINTDVFFTVTKWVCGICLSYLFFPRMAVGIWNALAKEPERKDVRKK